MASDNGQQRRQFMEAASLGLMFPLSIGIGFGWGYWMDKKLFHTWPWLTAIFTAFGVIAAFLNLFRTGMGSDGDKQS
ncbi:MAG: AtpZ/AtpI family protein [Acidobacteria bacterium]|nr:AtpZ/AtpI family protein [Acidobacteriota bacterium]